MCGRIKQIAKYLEDMAVSLKPMRPDFVHDRIVKNPIQNGTAKINLKWISMEMTTMALRKHVSQVWEAAARFWK